VKPKLPIVALGACLTAVAVLANCGGGAQQPRAQAGSPDLALAPDNLNFGMQVLGLASTGQNENLTNRGSSTLTFKSIGITGSNASDFIQNSSTCGSTLAPAQDCVVAVGFTPTQLGPSTAALTINDDTASSPHSVTINGIGVISGPNASLSASSLDFACCRGSASDFTSPHTQIGSFKHEIQLCQFFARIPVYYIRRNAEEQTQGRKS